jgi:hypothetical protein
MSPDFREGILACVVSLVAPELPNIWCPELKLPVHYLIIQQG